MSFVAGTWHLLFNEIYKRRLKRARGVALPKHVTHYGPRSRFPYNNLTTPIDRTPPIHHMRDALNSSVGLRYGNIHQYPHNQCTYYPISGHLSVFTAGQKVWNMNIQTSSRWPMLVNRRSIVFLRAKTLGEKNHPRVDKCRRPLHMKAIIVYCKKSIINQMYCTNIA